MNTLIFNKDEAYPLIITFKNKARKREITASDMILYNILRGKPLKSGFTPISRQIVLDNNGNEPWVKFNQALWDVRHHCIVLKSREITSEAVFLSPSKRDISTLYYKIWDIDVTYEQGKTLISLLQTL